MNKTHKNSKKREKTQFLKIWRISEKIEEFWASLVAFLSDFEHVVNKYVFDFFENFRNFRFFQSKTIKTHQIDCFESLGPSKNDSAYRFHVYKWSYHHISLIWNAKASTYSASGGKNPYIFVLASTYSASGGKNP